MTNLTQAILPEPSAMRLRARTIARKRNILLVYKAKTDVLWDFFQILLASFVDELHVESYE